MKLMLLFTILLSFTAQAQNVAGKPAFRITWTNSIDTNDTSTKTGRDLIRLVLFPSTVGHTILDMKNTIQSNPEIVTAFQKLQNETQEKITVDFYVTSENPSTPQLSDTLQLYIHFKGKSLVLSPYNLEQLLDYKIDFVEGLTNALYQAVSDEQYAKTLKEILNDFSLNKRDCESNNT